MDASRQRERGREDGPRRRVSPCTEDSLFHGGLAVHQPRRGYRFTEDAIVLAAFAASGGRARLAADLGAGAGVVGLMILHAGAAERALSVEIQPELVALARDNARANRLDGRLLAVRSDLRRLPLDEAAADLLVANPPYRPAGSGSLPADPQRAMARHELTCDPGALTAEARRCLSPAGRLNLVYPARRLDEVVAAGRAAGLEPRRVRLVLPGPDGPPTLVLLELGHGRSGFPVELPPLLTREASGRRSAEMETLAAGRFPAPAGGRTQSSTGPGRRTRSSPEE